MEELEPALESKDTKKGRLRKTQPKKQRIVDAETRSLLASKRLDALENDNFTLLNTGNDAPSDDSDYHDDGPDYSSSNKKSKTPKLSKSSSSTNLALGGAQYTKFPRYPSLKVLLEKEGIFPDRNTLNYWSADCTVYGPEEEEEGRGNRTKEEQRKLKEILRPQRNFCSVCGNNSHYNCVQCGFKYCKEACYVTHKETRCLKQIS